jgi:hypothetical protein
MEVGTLQDVQEIKNEENDFEENGSSSPMVYQLVRVYSYFLSYITPSKVHNSL